MSSDDVAAEVGPETRTGMTIETPPGDPFLGVRASGVPLLVPAGEVREVVRAGRPTRVPGATPPFRGLLGLRGEMVSVVALEDIPGVFDGDVEKWLKTTGVTTTGIRPDRIEAVLVLRGGRHPIGLQVGGVDEVRMIEVDDHDGSAAPAPYDGACWGGTAHVGDGLLGIVDVDRIRETLAALVEQAAKRAEEVPADLDAPDDAPDDAADDANGNKGSDSIG